MKVNRLSTDQYYGFKMIVKSLKCI